MTPTVIPAARVRSVERTGALGRSLIALAMVVPVAIQTAADFSSTHIFNPEWLPHARFHNALHVFHLWELTVLTLVLLWWGRLQTRALRVAVAAWMPVLWALPFFFGLLVPGTSYEPYPGTIPWVGPVPLNVFVSCVAIVVAALGYLIDRSERGHRGAGGAVARRLVRYRWPTATAALTAMFALLMSAGWLATVESSATPPDPARAEAMRRLLEAPPPR